MKQQKRVTRKNGITLISLVITIVIMLILASVAISIAVSPEGLFGQAQNATEQWSAKVDEEQTEFDKVLGYLGIEPATQISDKMPEGKGWDNSATGSIDKVATQGSRVAPIPKGYTVSQIPGENSISGGLVIYQTDEGQVAVSGEANSAEHITAMETRNQYVWIPVDDINDMVMCKKNGSDKKIDGTAATEGEKTVCELEYDTETGHITCNTHGYSTAIDLTADTIDTIGLAGRVYGFGTASIETTESGDKIYQKSMIFTEESKAEHKFVANYSNMDNYREPDLVTGYDTDDGTNTYMATAGITDGKAATFKARLNSDFIEMAKSVAKYGGFYISRYEVGYDTTDVENSKVISKKNQKVLTSYVGTPSSTKNYLEGNMWYRII